MSLVHLQVMWTQTAFTRLSKHLGSKRFSGTWMASRTQSKPCHALLNQITSPKELSAPYHHIAATVECQPLLLADTLAVITASKENIHRPPKGQELSLGKGQACSSQCSFQSPNSKVGFALDGLTVSFAHILLWLFGCLHPPAMRKTWEHQGSVNTGVRGNRK
jgi:hypothetical protein